MIVGDLICKAVTFGGHESAYVVLPQDSHDPIVQSYLRGETPNDYMMDILHKTTTPGDLVLDVGCHVGTLSIGASALGRPTIAVDANPLHVDLVTKSVRINGLSNLTVINRAISTKPGQIRFIPDGVYGMIDYSGKAGSAITVDTESLDNIILNYAEGRPLRFLKMDVEGAEFDALTSGKATLLKDQPILWWESNGPTLDLAGYTIKDVRGLLEGFGYRTFRVEGDRWIYAPPDQIQPDAWLDMLSLSQTDQDRWAHRLQWEWSEPEIEACCRHWLNFLHRHTLEHLIGQLANHPSSLELASIAAEARERLQKIVQPS